ncbi:MAG: hypothetical protein ABWY94_07475 [Pseudoxanthomonas sp.]
MLMLGSCSCGRQPGVEDVSAAARTDQPAPAPEAMSSAAKSPTAEALAKNAANLSQAASTVHAYLAAVAGKNWKTADSYWAGGKAPPRPDDYVVRGIEDLGSMRINNQEPEPLDEEIPTRAVEIPVALLVRGGKNVRKIEGWYRLRRKVDDAGWEITSASLRPSLD